MNNRIIELGNSGINEGKGKRMDRHIILLVSKPVNFPARQPINQSTRQPINQLTRQLSSSSTNQPINSSTCQPVNLSTSQPINQSCNQSKEFAFGAGRAICPPHLCIAGHSGPIRWWWMSLYMAITWKKRVLCIPEGKR